VTDPLVMTSELLAGAGLTGLGAWAWYRPDQPLVWRELRFPRDLEGEQVEALLTHVAVRRRPVVFVIEATSQRIRFLVGAPKTVLSSVASALSGIAPEVRLDALAAETPPAPSSGARAWWSGPWPLLRTDGVEMAVAGLLGALTAVGTNEQVRVVVRLLPAGPVARPAADADRALQTKLSGPLVRAEVLLAVTAEPAARAHHLGQAVIASLRTLDGPGSRLRLRRLSAAGTRRAMSRSARVASWRLAPTTLLSPAELVPIVSLPVASPRVAGVSYGTAPRLMPSARIPTNGHGRTFARSDWPAARGRRLVQPPSGATTHSLLVGPTGVGKSTLTVGLALDDARQGRGVLLLDLKGDSAEDFLARLAPARHDDVIVLEPASGLPVPGLRVFGSGEPELAADMLLGTFRGLFKDSWGVLSDQYLRLGLASLAHDRQSTLADLPVLFGNPAFRARLLRRVSDPMLLGEWRAYEALSPAQQVEQLASPLRKIGALVHRRTIRAVVGQSAPRFDLRRVLRERKIVVVALSPGRLGQPAVQLIASLLLWELYSAVLARQSLPEGQRRLFGLYLDEPKVLSHLPVPLDSMFELFRGMQVAMTMTAQSIAQLPKPVAAAAISNAATLAVFRQHAEADATLLARELGTVSSDQLKSLDPYHLVMRLGLGPGEIADAATGSTIALSPATGDANELRRHSAQRYGLSVEQVDAALAARHGLQPPATDPDAQPDDVEAGAGFGRRRSS